MWSYTDGGTCVGTEVHQPGPVHPATERYGGGAIGYVAREIMGSPSNSLSCIMQFEPLNLVGGGTHAASNLENFADG